MAKVKFQVMSQAKFETITPANGTLYRVQQTDGSEHFYHGSKRLDNQAAIDAAIAELDYTVGVETATGGDVNVLTGFEVEDGKLKANSRTQQLIKKVAVSGDAEDLTYDNTDSGLSATDVKAAIDEIASQSAGGVNSKTVYITETSGLSGDAYSKRYGIYQGATGSVASPVASEKLADIDIPKDMVVEDAVCRKATAQDVEDAGANPGFVVGDYIIVMTIANSDGTKLFIPVQSLVDIYTAEQNATQIQLVIDNNNVISATIVDGSVDTDALAALAVTTAKIANEAVTEAKLADDAVTTDKIKDGEVTEDKLAADVKTKLNKSVGVETVAESTTNGSISVTTDGVTADVPVHGLGSAAYAATTDFDAAGSAAAVQGTAADTSDKATVYGVKAYVDASLEWEVVE